MMDFKINSITPRLFHKIFFGLIKINRLIIYSHTVDIIQSIQVDEILQIKKQWRENRIVKHIESRNCTIRGSNSPSFSIQISRERETSLR